MQQQVSVFRNHHEKEKDEARFTGTLVKISFVHSGHIAIVADGDGNIHEADLNLVKFVVETPEVVDVSGYEKRIKELEAKLKKSPVVKAGAPKK